MRRILISWIGDNDVKGIAGGEGNHGAVAGFLAEVEFRDAFTDVLLLDTRRPATAPYVQWLMTRTKAAIRRLELRIDRPHDFDEVYDRTRDAVLEAATDPMGAPIGEVVYLLSSGTKAMSSALMLIGCSDLVGRIYFSWTDGRPPEPANGYVHIRWPERFSLSLFAMRPIAGPREGAVLTADGRKELSNDPAMKRTYARATQAAPSPIPVLIRGETGTGKELLARYIHEKSLRSKGKFVAVNCGAIPPTLIDSTLFGHVQGAFTGAYKTVPGTFETAKGGTVFLDEIGELPLETQTRLLRVLQEQQVTKVGDVEPTRVDVRIVAATHRDLRAMVREETFRADLWFRLAGYTLMLPPLRNRTGDLRHLAAEILAEDAVARGAKTILDEGAWRVLQSYNWPGNVRELQNIIRRCCVDATGRSSQRVVSAAAVREVLQEQGLGFGGHASAVEAEDWAPGFLAEIVASDGGLGETMDRIEAAIVRAAVQAEGTQKAAARVLGTSEQSISGKKERWRQKGYWR